MDKLFYRKRNPDIGHNISRREFTGILGVAGICATGAVTGLTACTNSSITSS
jgi:hypothetical protein